MSKPPWGSDEDSSLTDLVFETNYSPREIALQMNVSETFIRARIKELGISWVRRCKGNLSRGQGSLTQILRKLLPGEDIKTEEPIGNRQFLDIYCPKYKLGIEYHGRQHYEFVAHFHGDLEGFEECQLRDERKLQTCKDLQIVLVSFRYNDDLSENAVYNRLLEAVRSAPVVEQKPLRKNLKTSDYYQSAKQRRRDYNRELYRRKREHQRNNPS